jgi:VanZ family protein
MRPNVLSNGHHEHFAAYFLTGLLLGFAYSHPRQLLFVALLLLVYAGALELLQVSMPGRSSSLDDFVASWLGAWGVSSS